MFYIIETKDQLNKVISYQGNEKVFIEIIPVDDRIHPTLNSPSLIYFRPLTAKRGFIIAIDHFETFSLSYDFVMSSLIAKIPQIYTIDRKTLLYYGFGDLPVKGLKMAYTLFSSNSEIPNISKFDTEAHKFYNNRLGSRNDLNKFIPVSKHYEKYENLFKTLKFDDQFFSSNIYNFYNKDGSDSFYNIEKSGIRTDEVVFNDNFPGFHRRFSLKDDLIYSSYNLYNLTARPSCIFNGFNFLGLPKDESRGCFIPRNDLFVEFDYKSYQIRLLANLLDYKFEESDIHAHLAKLYGEPDYDKAKKITFRYVYGRDPEAPDIPFFKEVYELRDYLWSFYQKNQYIPSPKGRKIFNISEITQILPYLMQSIETETNIEVINDIFKFLPDYKTKLVLYSYDAFLFDISMEDDDIVPKIEQSLRIANCEFSVKYGESYDKLIRP